MTHYRATRVRNRKIFDEPDPGLEFIEVRRPREAEQCLGFLADRPARP